METTEAAAAWCTVKAKAVQELTEDDFGTLQHAAYLRRRFDAGIFPCTIGQRSRFLKLVRRGLLEFDSWGRDMDGEIERDVEIYKLTAAGDAVANRQEGSA